MLRMIVTSRRLKRKKRKKERKEGRKEGRKEERKYYEVKKRKKSHNIVHSRHKCEALPTHMYNT